MRKRHSQLSLLSLALIVALVSSVAGMPAFAASAGNAQQAAQVAMQQSGGSGKVLGVTTETDSRGNRVFAVKILSNGRVRVVRIPQN